ncbi:palmitoyltransferase ZDHHC23-B isoform X2 [Teleopsis dalmanni]|nr:palmitoyltransferase ZDHHC23-B isoform X2 [Teleopsis dalmanni]XP_037957418.1 palmitoyltransferase ZDHHC23-B isoform X2 [Teleopsis dalmanni]
MLLAFQDRLRIPWRGGAKQFSFDVILPIFVLPILIGIAAINAYTATVIFVSGTVFITYAYLQVKRALVRTRFFCLWILWSILYMLILFEFTVPLFELLPEENIILMMLVFGAFFCLLRTKQRAVLNVIVYDKSSVNKTDLPNIIEDSPDEEVDAPSQTTLLLEQDYHDGDVMGERPLTSKMNACPTCRKYTSFKAGHCTVCTACIMRHDHHSYWLDCCIGMSNHLYYLIGLLLAELALLLGAYLTLTAVCHPFLLLRVVNVPIMLPDDCTDVFDEYELGVSFVVAVYAVIIAAYVLMALVRQIYRISRGQPEEQNTCFYNWRAFLF